jgi:UTP--glucose-1-phosphate uridylyltransferase
MPLTNAVPKVLFPFVDKGSSVKAVLHVLLEEVREAGIDDARIVVSLGQKAIVRRYLDAVQDYGKVSLPAEISFIEQEKPRGFGDAVLCTKHFVDAKPFVLLLGDHIHLSSPGESSCISQVVEAFGKVKPKAMIGVHDVDEAVIHTMGVAAGTPVRERIYRCARFLEKPDRETARQQLCTKGLPEGRFLTHCGIYVFDAEIFDCLEQEKSQIGQSGKELELAAAQARLLQRYPDSYYLCRIHGRAYDMGNPEGYLKAFAAMAGINAE